MSRDELDRPSESCQLRIGDYIVLYDLGSGTTGKVKLAQQAVNSRVCAMKIIKKSLFKRVPGLEAKVHREIALMRL
jgi:serine/threonine protein kinase